MRIRWSLLALAAVAAAPTLHAQAWQYANVNGATLRFYEMGQGTPLVLLHPFGSCAAAWRPFTDSLAADHRLILVEMRGHGGSTNPSNDFTHRESARDVLALLDTLGLPRVQAIGMSSGAMTLLHLATLAPERVEAMIIVSGTPRYLPETRALLNEMTSLDVFPPEVQAEWRQCAVRGDEQVQTLVRQFRGFKDNHDDMAFDAATLGRITARTLIVQGDRDPFFPVDLSVEMYHEIPGSALWVVPEEGHIPVFGTVAPTFLARARRWLGSGS